MKSADATISDIKGIRAEDIKPAAAKWRADFEKQLLEAHTKAYELGRKRAGVRRPAPKKAAAYAQRVLKNERQFIDRFESDLANGRYHVKLQDSEKLLPNTSQIDRRLLQYLHKARATAQDAFGISSGSTAWSRVTLGRENCSTCPSKAGLYESWEQLKAKGIPADGSDECKTNCECIVYRESDGRNGFSAVFEGGDVSRMLEDGTPSGEIVIDPGKINYLTEWRADSDKSNLLKPIGFDQSNASDLLNELKRVLVSDDYQLQVQDFQRAEAYGVKYFLVTKIVGPEGERLFKVIVQEHPRLGLRLLTLLKPTEKDFL